LIRVERGGCGRFYYETVVEEAVDVVSSKLFLSSVA
jgi:hypothetical protein